MKVARKYPISRFNGNSKLAASVAFGDEMNVCPDRWLARTLLAQGKNVFTY